ncbi:unnamed protein product [Victoria cruziana]
MNWRGSASDFRSNPASDYSCRHPNLCWGKDYVPCIDSSIPDAHPPSFHMFNLSSSQLVLCDNSIGLAPPEEPIVQQPHAHIVHVPTNNAAYPSTIDVCKTNIIHTRRNCERSPEKDVIHIANQV